MAPSDTPPDRWDKADVIFKAISSVLMPLAIVSLGYFGNKYLQESQAHEARNRLQTELMSKREESESALRKDMFKSIIDSFLVPRAASTADKMLHLQLLTYNFYESFNLKPLFAHFDDDLGYRMSLLPARPAGPPGRERTRACGDASRASLEACRATLYELARYIAEKQRAMLEQVGKKFDMTLKLKDLTQGPQGGVPLNEATLSLLPGVEWNFRVDALEAAVATKKVRVRLSVTSLPRNLEQQYEFWAEPFDFPIIDNIRLSNDERFAVVLTSFDDEQGLVHLTAVYFPGTYASLKEKPFLDEAIRRLAPNSAVNRERQ
jgi:hypothetical protein